MHEWRAHIFHFGLKCLARVVIAHAHGVLCLTTRAIRTHFERDWVFIHILVYLDLCMMIA